jgi:hypothetical protein
MWKNLNNKGRIPAKTPCPYRDKCEIAKNEACYHKGTDHPCHFSCATARAFDLLTQANPC